MLSSYRKKYLNSSSFLIDIQFLFHAGLLGHPVHAMAILNTVGSMQKVSFPNSLEKSFSKNMKRKMRTINVDNEIYAF